MDFSRITEQLFIGTTPSLSRGDYDRLRNSGVYLVINMRWGHRSQPDPYYPPLKFLWLRTFDSPLLPIPMKKLHHGVNAALRTFDEGGKVYVYCAGGRHRSVTMGACILIAQGYDPREAMDLIIARRRVADPDAYYIRARILKFAKEWANRS